MSSELEAMKGEIAELRRLIRELELLE